MINYVVKAHVHSLNNNIKRRTLTLKKRNRQRKRGSMKNSHTDSLRGSVCTQGRLCLSLVVVFCDLLYMLSVKGKTVEFSHCSVIQLVDYPKKMIK